MNEKSIKYEYYKQLALAYKNAAKLMRCVASIHVEALEDKFFWERTFKSVKPLDEFYFIAYTRTKDGNLATGCATCLNYRNFISKEFFICIDSDYRYLLMEKNIDVQHAIFQTYTYSIENHYCYAEGIDRIFKNLGFENTYFDFESFLKSYSGILYELFLFHLYSLSLRDGIFTKDDFRVFAGFEKISLSADQMLDTLRKKVTAKIAELKNRYPTFDMTIWEEKYNKLGVSRDNAYLFFRGHTLFERIILPIAKDIRKKLEYRHTAEFPGKEKGAYFAANKDLKSYFIENIQYGAYPEIVKIENDIRIFLN